MVIKELNRQQIIDSEFTIECPTCNYILIGFEPRYFIECNRCIENGSLKDSSVSSLKERIVMSLNI